MHVNRIDEGFLSTLGARFLRRLYGRAVKSHHAAAFVAVDADGTAIGFAAACNDLGSFYRHFVLRDGLVAGFVAAPRIARSWRRVFETLRYPSHAGDLPAAEILSVAVDERASGRGVGRALVDACARELNRAGVPDVKVVAGSHNAAARALYTSCGFAEVARIEVHNGVESSVYVRPCALVATGTAAPLRIVGATR
jgi:ribosomal protein S18 acetylase RimI-like enzyme